MMKLMMKTTWNLSGQPRISFLSVISRGWRGNPQIKVTGMLFVSLTRGNCRFLGATYSGVSKIAIGITGLRENLVGMTGLHENLGRDNVNSRKFGSG